MSEPVSIVFFPESPGITPAIRRWRERNPEWRRPLDEVIVCPVCGISVRAIADYALLDERGVRAQIAWYRDVHLRASCSAHSWPTEEHWAVQESRSR